MVSLAGPRLVALVTLRGRAVVLGKSVLRDEVVVTSWHCPVSDEPRLYMVALSVKRAHALSIVRESGVFVVNIVSESLREVAVAVSHHAGEFVDTFGHTGLSMGSALKVDAPRLKAALSWLECEVLEEVVTGDHVCFIGKVVHAEMRDERAPRLLDEGEFSRRRG